MRVFWGIYHADIVTFVPGEVSDVLVTEMDREITKVKKKYVQNCKLQNEKNKHKT
jgi:hypothetical protein